ncbi:DUF819 domain-containing protein [Aquirufa echingensis]|jgi:uncharacterized membrane protein|uniref:DUF819 family protein n=1 Tax=Aquirufa echingensis TaxID=3096516 RepID=A0ABW6CYJ9_9BACT
MIQGELYIFISLIIMLAGIFYLSKLKSKIVKLVFSVIPPLLFCYFLPSLLVEQGIIVIGNTDLNGTLAKTLLPFCIFYFTLGLPLAKLKAIGRKPIILFLVGALGVIIGGPISLMISHYFFPTEFNAESFRGLSTIAGSWIGGTANQMALNAIFLPNADELAKAVTVDVFFGETWLAILLFLIPFQLKINQYLKASYNHQDISVDWEEDLTVKKFTFNNLIYILGLGFLITLLSTYSGSYLTELIAITFLNQSFWTFFICTFMGIGLGLSPLKRLYTAGGDVIATLFLYFIIASIGLKISLSHLFSTPLLLFTGFIWISIHGLVIFVVGKWIKAPYHYMAIASQANVGGIASTSVIATAISPILAPLGVILALLGYAIGTYGGYLSAILMQWVSQTY